MNHCRNSISAVSCLPFCTQNKGPFSVGPEICDQEPCMDFGPTSFSELPLFLLRDRPCLDLIIVSSNFQALFFLQDKLLESV